jgi:hypothetical protein
VHIIFWSEKSIEGLYRVAAAAGVNFVDFRSSLPNPLSREAETLTSFSMFGDASGEQENQGVQVSSPPLHQ